MIRQLSHQFSAKDADVLTAVHKISEESRAAKKQAKASEEKLALFEARELVKNTKSRIVKKNFIDKSPEGARFLALNIIKQGERIVLFGAKSETRTHVILACTESLKFDMRRLIPVISPMMEGRGGGSPSLVEIAGNPRADLAAVLDRAEDFVKTALEQ
jgi:alanyl-tRNA synthetase